MDKISPSLDKMMDKLFSLAVSKTLIMATIKFYLTSNKPNASVYIRFSASRKVEFRRKTGITILSPKDDWSVPKGFPKTNTAENKNLNSKLKKLSEFILGKYNDDYNDFLNTDKEINSLWLKGVIDIFFNRSVISESDYFLVFAKEFVVELSKKSYTSKGVKRSYSPVTIEKYQNIVNHVEAFEQYVSKRYKIAEITDSFTKQLASYLADVKKLSINTIGRDVKRIKTIVFEAETAGHKVSHRVREIKGFEDEKIVVFLTFDEITKIRDTKFSVDKLQRAKDWLIIACYTGQRISDLWRMNKSMIIEEGSYSYILLSQYKTGKRVKIPIHWEVETILKKYNSDFPPMFSDNEKSNRTELSNLMKNVCREAGIIQKVEGRYNGVKGIYEKYKLIGNHSCRRSFASNFYGNQLFTTPMLMEITGHVKESNFLKYIAEEEFKFSEQTARSFDMLRKQMMEQAVENELQ
ncbi:MAG TPA: phage integrase SAM-like domain-containing protein [Flavobacterium sp.]